MFELERSTIEVLYSYGPKNNVAASPKEMILPIIEAMQSQIKSGIAQYNTKEAMLSLKKVICAPVSESWNPRLSIEEALWKSRNIKPYESYVYMENYLMEHYSQSMDIQPDEDLFLIGNFFDSFLYLVSRSMDSVWRIPNR